MSEQICNTLEKLNIENDDHWTSEGLPRLDVMKELGGVAVSRAQVTDAAKTFTRATPSITPEPVVEPVVEPVGAEGTPTPEPAVSPPVEPVEGARAAVDQAVNAESDEAVIQELEDAHAVMREAQARLRAAQAGMDAVVTRKADDDAGRTSAHDIKAYQKSQQAQRAGQALTQRSMVAAAKAAGQL